MLSAAEIRDVLRSETRSWALGPTESVYEFWVPITNGRADLVNIGTSLDGFEIKTDRDTLKRLPRQALDYERVFDRCFVAVAPRHLESASKLLPEWWGLIAFDDRSRTFELVRAASWNTRVDPETIVRLLWRDEAYHLLCSYGSAPNASTGRFKLWQELLRTLHVDALRDAVRATLLKRHSRIGASAEQNASPVA